ncbi:hypothetical protein Acr_00g0019600 [Actinidia rufa]|uniref:Uncharacterized protein n=1 Tax=Actinidia rufa TaxID=165716 RepID=A0A7J0DBR3_9ERIC|nr:hypothetical protein Acr_00g0019600 [Actinidia rufa]
MNLFSLNKNPKPNQGWLYFKARPKKALLKGYPSNIKGWKEKNFFVSGDVWEFPDGATKEVGAPTVPRSWGTPSKHCNGLSRLFEGELERFGEVASLVEEKGFYSVPVLLESKSFRRSFGLPKPMASRTVGDDAPTSPGDMGEFRHSRDELSRGGPFQDSLIEFIGTIRGTDRILSHLPDQMLLSILGAKIRSTLGAWEPGSLSLSSRSLSLSSSSEAMLESWLPSKLKSDESALRSSVKKVEKSKNGGSVAGSTPVKGVVIGEKHLREDPTNSPSKKGKAANSCKGKEVAPALETKKEGSAGHGDGGALKSHFFAEARGGYLNQSWYRPKARLYRFFF